MIDYSIDRAVLKKEKSILEQRHRELCIQYDTCSKYMQNSIRMQIENILEQINNINNLLT